MHTSRRPITDLVKVSTLDKQKERMGERDTHTHTQGQIR